ncbi:MAG: hypothetical protein HY332_24010 [Chloroflexi bacterium]|nr:hypothetical protein [Chloroflexota bacterium]
MAATVALTFPHGSRIHLPVHWTYGVVLDASMPVGERYPRAVANERPPALVFPFVLVENPEGRGGGLEVAARSADEVAGTERGGGGGFPATVRRRRAMAMVERTRDGFRLELDSGSDVAAIVRSVPSAEAAIANHHDWLRRTFGVRPLDERIVAGEAPAWAADVPVLFTFDMWRPSGEVAHNYLHLRDCVRDLHALGLPPGAVFYVPGWCAPYDGGYPEYRPAPELGGRGAFREAVDAAHDAGYRIMVHTLAWGADPSRRDFERLAPAAVRNWPRPHPAKPPPPIVHPHQMERPPAGETIPAAPSEDPLRGPYAGWPGGGPRTALDYDSGRLPVGPIRPTARGWTFETAELPQRCEAVFTIGGLGAAGHGLVQVTVNGRTFTTPAGWFRQRGAYTFPFTYVFLRGANTVEIACLGWPENRGGPGGAPPDLDDAWYKISQAYDHPGPTWTVPAVGMDADSPLWQRAFVEYLAPTVAEFGIDAVHVDATTLWRWDEHGFFGNLRRSLPPQTVFGTEVATGPGLGFFLFSQTRVSPPPAADRAWQPERSDLPWQITGHYQHFYQHLCSPRGFVPVGSVCNIDPVATALSAEEIEATKRMLAWSREQHIVPNLRVNYRDYGLDPGTRAFLLEYVINAR